MCGQVDHELIDDIGVGALGISAVRLVDLCVNILSGEKTSYHRYGTQCNMFLSSFVLNSLRTVDFIT